MMYESAMINECKVTRSVGDNCKFENNNYQRYLNCNCLVVGLRNVPFGGTDHRGRLWWNESGPMVLGKVNGWNEMDGR